MRERRHEPHVSETPGAAGAWDGLSRRALLRGALAAAGAGIVQAVTARAQVTGLMPGGGTVPLRLPKGALTYLDRKQYIHNMEIISFTPGVEVAGGEPLMNMWARGAQRLLAAGDGWLDVSDPRKPVVIKTAARIQGCIAYNTRLRKWIMVSSAGQPITRAIPQYPYGQYHKELADRSNAYTGLRGIRTFDITDPTRPVLLQEYSIGKTGWGTHMNFYDGGQYAYLAAGWDDQFFFENAQRTSGSGLMIVDLTDPANVKEVSRWWVPGQRRGEEAEYDKYWFAGDGAAWNGTHSAPTVPKRVEDGGRYGYGGFGHYGFFVFDFSDIRNPKPVSQLLYDHETLGGAPYHTVYPLIADAAHPRLQNLVIGLSETIQADCREPVRFPRVIDVSDPASPRIIALFPRPRPPKDAPYADFCLARGRFGTHNCQAWLAPGVSRPEIMAITWFVAGLRVHDLSDPTQPRELAWFVPARDGEIEDFESWWRGTSETCFVEWDRNLIWLGAHAGTYCLSTPVLGRPVLEARPIERWTVPHGNAGWDDQTPRRVYLGRGLIDRG